MEDFALDIVVGAGKPHARTYRLDLPRFTVVGATTRHGQLTPALSDRFGESYRLDFYSPDECAQIVLRSARILGVEVVPAGAGAIARRARGTARVCNRLLRRVRDFAEVEADGVVTKAVANQALEDMGVDPEGLDSMDRRILTTIIESYAGGPRRAPIPGRHRGRGSHHAGVPLRALSAAGRLPCADVPRSRRHAEGVRAPGFHQG